MPLLKVTNASQQGKDTEPKTEPPAVAGGAVGFAFALVLPLVFAVALALAFAVAFAVALAVCHRRQPMSTANLPETPAAGAEMLSALVLSRVGSNHLR